MYVAVDPDETKYNAAAAAPMSIPVAAPVASAQIVPAVVVAPAAASVASIAAVIAPAAVADASAAAPRIAKKRKRTWAERM